MYEKAWGIKILGAINLNLLHSRMNTRLVDGIPHTHRVWNHSSYGTGVLRIWPPAPWVLLPPLVLGEMPYHGAWGVTFWAVHPNGPGDEMQKSMVVSLSQSARFDQLERENERWPTCQIFHSSPRKPNWVPPTWQKNWLCLCGDVDGFTIHQLKRLSLFPIPFFSPTLI